MIQGRAQTGVSEVCSHVSWLAQLRCQNDPTLSRPRVVVPGSHGSGWDDRQKQEMHARISSH
jgi:hypothetical protein